MLYSIGYRFFHQVQNEGISIINAKNFHQFWGLAMAQPGNTKGGRFTVPLTSCLTGLESAVWQQTIFVFICKKSYLHQSIRRSTVQWYFPQGTLKYHCTVDLLFDLFGLVCFANKNKNFQLSHSTADTNPVKQEVNGTLILLPLVFPGSAVKR